MIEDLIPHNIVVSEFYGKPSHSEGVICLNVLVGNEGAYNMLLGREWIH